MAFEKDLQTYLDNLSKLRGNAHYRDVNPFRGLEFFDAEHAPFFHGRTKTVGEVLNVLQQQAAEKKPFVLVLGPDGSGKTSLVRAGILPVLTQVGITDGDRSWRLALTRPADGGSGDPIDALAAALLNESALPELPDAATRNGWQNLAAELREVPENAALRLREALQYLSVPVLDHFADEQGFEVPPANLEESVELPGQDKLGGVHSKVQLALVVDQLEELFVGGFPPELQRKYIAALGALVKWRVAFVIATLRSDFYASFQKYCSPQDLAVLNQPEFCVRDFDLSEILRGSFDLRPPNPQETRDMIRLPAEATGLRFELDPETGRSLDAALLEAATAHTEPLPLVEHVLWQLYRRQLPRKDGLLRWSDYRELGELDGALANHAESVFLALDGDAQAALKPVIRQLVSPGPGEDSVLIRRTVPYRDLVSRPQFGERQKTVAQGVIDRFIKEGFFHAEKTGPNAEVLVSITQECLLRNWPRVRQLLNEDLVLLRVRDRLEPNFKLWLSRGRRGRDLLRTRSGIREAKTLLRSFRASLSNSQVDYLQKSLRAQNRRCWFRITGVLAAVAGLLAPVIINGIQWLSADIERRKVEQPSDPEGKSAHSAVAKRGSFEVEQSQPNTAAQVPRGNAAPPMSERDPLQARLRDIEAKGQQIQKSLELVTRQRDALQVQLNDTEAKVQQAQKDAALVTNQRDALQNQLKDSEARAQQAQKDVKLVASQRDALQSQLKELTQKNAELPADQRDALQSQLKDAEAKAQQIQKSLELVTTQRDALQSQLKEVGAKAQEAQKNAELVTGQRDALQNQLKDTEAKAQQAQKDAALATSQQDAMQGQLRDSEGKAQQAQKNLELVTSQRDALENQLKEIGAKAQDAQKNTEVVTGQRDALQNQLKDTEAKAQQAQKDAALVTSRRDALQSQLKELTQKNAELPADQRDALQTRVNDAEARAQQIQKNLELALGQQDVLRKRLEDTEAKAQQAQKDAALAGSQRDALQARLKDSEAKTQQAQKAAALAASEADALQSHLKESETKTQETQKDAASVVGQRDGSQEQLAGLSTEAQQAEKDERIGSAGATAPIGVNADPTQKNEPMMRDQEPATLAGINQSQAAVPLPTPSVAASLELTPEVQTDQSSKASAEERSLKEFVLEYIRTVASNDASTQAPFFEPRVNYFGEGLISRSGIQASMDRYRRQWPVRNWEPRGEPEFPKTLHSTNPKLYEVVQPLNWTVSNGLQHKQGSARLYFRIWKNDKGEFHIVHIEQRNRRSESQNN